MYSSRNSIHHPLICPIKDSQIQLSFKSKSEIEERLNRPGSQSYKMDNFITVSLRSQKFNVSRNSESEKGQKKPLTGEILRSMKCEVKPILTRPSGSTQEMRVLGVLGIKRQVSNANKETRFSRCQQKKPHLQIIYTNVTNTQKKARLIHHWGISPGPVMY